MSAWNHTLRAMNADAIASHQRHGWSCSSPKCKERAEFEATFDSVTGRAGRVNTRRKMLCERHAHQFAEKNGVSVGG